MMLQQLRSRPLVFGVSRAIAALAEPSVIFPPSGPRVLDRRSADFDNGLVNDENSGRLSAVQIPPLLWPIY
jgi:hypothetical protein